MNGKMAIILAIVFVGVSSLLCCGGFLFLGASMPSQPVEPNGAPPPVATTASSEAEKPLPDVGADAKVLRLAPPQGAKAEDVAACVAILNRRFEKAHVVGYALEEKGKVVVRLKRDADMMKRAGKLLAAGGHLQFLELLTPAQMPEEELKKEVARITAAKAQGTYDAAKEKWNVLATETDEAKLALTVNAGGVEGHLVASANPRKTDDQGWVIDFAMNPEGQDAFEAFSKRLLDKEFAVVLDDVIKMVFWSRGVIREEGYMFKDAPGFSEDEARALTALMTSGRLPIDLTMEED